MELLVGCFLGGGGILILLVVGALYYARTSSRQHTHSTETSTPQTYDAVVEDWNRQSESVLHDFMETLATNQRKEKN